MARLPHGPKETAADVPADLAVVPTRIAVDWIYQAIHPLQYALSPTAAWLVVGVVTLGLALLPWLPPARRAPVARVDLANCNGCGRCQADCPYAAVTLQPRTDGRSAPRQAVVDAELCAACGICSGACPSSTPFRNVAELVTGIDMPQRPLTRVRDELERALARLRGDAPIVVFGCQCGADVARLAAPDTAAVPLLCTGMLPPSFIEYALRSGAAGVLVTGCREGGCAFRLGNRWTEARLAGEREPHLRAGIARSRVNIAWAGAADDDRLAAALARLRASLCTQVLPASTVRPKRQENVDG
jgi:coenzyme F420-reducing hydrogenase delta subunit/NAD-dependent dihydropyrimidine dehydrogenase PreA subunit